MTTPRSVRRLALAGSLLLLIALSALLIARFARPSAPSAPDPAPARSEDEAGVEVAWIGGPSLRARAASDPAVVAPERVTPEPAVPGPASPAVPGPAARAPAAPPPAVAGMVVGLDPETGAWGPPTPEQLRELAEIRRRTEADEHRVAKPDGTLPEVHHPDGHVSVDLNGQFQEFTTVRIGPDGKPVFTCVPGSEEAERAVVGPATPPLEER